MTPMALADAVAALRAAAALHEVQDTVRHAARAVVAADGATFVLRDGDCCFYADEDALSPLWKGQRFPMTECISGWAMMHDTAAVVPDITIDERVPLDAYRPTFVRSLAMIPIGTGAGDPVGAIGVYWARAHTASDRDLARLTELAYETAHALARVGLADAPFTPPAINANG